MLVQITKKKKRLKFKLVKKKKKKKKVVAFIKKNNANTHTHITVHTFCKKLQAMENIVIIEHKKITIQCLQAPKAQTVCDLR